jgi:hypothetical protein
MALFRTKLQSAHSLLVWVHLRGNPLQVQLQGASRKAVASQHRLSLLVTISLTSPTQADRTPRSRNLPLVCKNTQPPFSVRFAQNGLLGHIICVLIFAPTPMSDHSCALSVAKLSLDSMIGSDMKDCILARRNLFARVSLVLEGIGVVVGSLLVPMLWGDIFDQKLAGYASSHYLTKKPLKELEREC